MPNKIKSIKRFNSHFKSFSFSNSELPPEEEYLESVTELDEKGNTKMEAKYSDDGDLEEKNSYEYNDEGKLLEHTLLYAVEDATEKRMLKRNEKGLLVEEIKYYGNDSGERTEYVYDEKDNLIERKYFDEEGNFTAKENFNYDESGSIIEELKYGSNEELESKITFTRPDDKTIEQCEYKSDGRLESRTMVKFNEEGKEISSVQTTADGKLISSVEDVYDEKGNVSERHFKDFYSKSIRYQYDENNRCIVQELFDGNGILLRKNMYAFDEDGNIIAEHTYEMDTTRGGRDKHFETRYEYEFY